MNEPSQRPLIGLTMGDVAGIGPEVIVRGWLDERLHNLARPLVIGDPAVLERAVALVGRQSVIWVQPVSEPELADPSPRLIPCLAPSATPGDLSHVVPGKVDPRAARPPTCFSLRPRIWRSTAGSTRSPRYPSINTPCASGVGHPGHTEILADFCGVIDHAMMLYLETNASRGGGSPAPSARHATGLGVVHVTLHVALKRVFELVTTEAVLSKIRLADRAMRPLTAGLPPRIAVSALNPHAGEDGLFGDEEQTIIRPAVDLASREGIDVAGPFPNDTLFYHALGGRVRRRRGDVS